MRSSKRITIFAYTDGSAVVKGKNKGNGGFGTYFPDLFGEKKAFSLGYKNTKTGRMEITALLYALKAVPSELANPIRLIVYSDSEYVVKSFTEGRLRRWVANGWTNSSGEVKNKDLWEQVVNILNKKRFVILEMRHIKSHQVDKEKDKLKKKELLRDPHIKGNFVADYLANYKRHEKLI